MTITKTTPHSFRSLREITEASYEAGRMYFDSCDVGTCKRKISEVIYPVRGGALFVESSVTPDGRRLYSVLLALRKTRQSMFSIDWLDDCADYASRSGAHAAAKREQARRS
jgi:hypothetical protein